MFSFEEQTLPVSQRVVKNNSRSGRAAATHLELRKGAQEHAMDKVLAQKRTYNVYKPRELEQGLAISIILMFQILYWMRMRLECSTPPNLLNPFQNVLYVTHHMSWTNANSSFNFHLAKGEKS